MIVTGILCTAWLVAVLVLEVEYLSRKRRHDKGSAPVKRDSGAFFTGSMETLRCKVKQGLSLSILK
jgi:hypothetical protein